MLVSLQMLEPTTVSIGLYFLAHPPRIHHRVFKKPLFLQRICKKVRKIQNNEVIRNVVWDELGDALMDQVHILPSWTLCLLYVCLLFVVFVA